MRYVGLVLSLWLIAPLAHAQSPAAPVPSPQPGPFGYKLLGGFVGNALALTLSAGTLVLVLADADDRDDDCIECDSGYFVVGPSFGAVVVSGLVYTLSGPLMTGGGVAIAGSLTHRDSRFDLAVGGAAIGMVTSVVLALGVYGVTDDDSASAIMLIASGLTLPPVFSALFSELAPTRRSHAAARVTPIVAISPSRSALFVGASGAF